MRRAARPSPSVCGHLATLTPVMRPSPSRSNLGGGSHLATSRSGLAPAAIHSTCRAPITKAHGTLSVVAGYGRGSTRSIVLHTVCEYPRPQTSTSSRRSGSVSPQMTRVPSGDGSWWFRRMNHHRSAQRTLRRHVRSRETPTAPRDGRRSSAKRYPHVPATYASSSKRQGCRHSTAIRITWV
jgi:hypothetical protein